MSKWDVARALKQSDLPAPARLVLWDLLDSADADTAVIPEEFTPSLTDLARTTGLGRSTVKRELNRLERGGWVRRARPDPVKARTEFARTGYRLAVPPGSTVDPGPEPRPTVDPDLGPERDGPGSTVGHIPTPHHLDLDQSTDDDQKFFTDEAIATAIDAVRDRTGTTITKEWAASRVIPCIVNTTDGTPRDIGDLVAYLRKAIQDEPDPRGRFLPSLHATPQARERPPWCGTCDERTRLAEDDTGRPKRCRCHPLHGQPLARPS